MAEYVRFIHAADIHLGAPFKGIHELPDEWASLVRTSIPDAFERLVAAALNNEVDFVALAGDLFDQTGPSYHEYCRAMEGFERLGQAGIPVYFCPGNHDPAEYWQRYYGALSRNVHVFPAGREGGFFLYEREGKPLVMLAGRGYYQRFWPLGHDIARGLTREEARAALGTDAPFAVGVLHAGLDIDPLKAPVDPAELLASGMDYWALGHIHSRYVDNPNDTHIAFSGCIQGRALKNTGAHGVNLVTLREGKPNEIEFIPTASVAWWRIAIDASRCESLDELSDCIVAELRRVQSESFCGKLMVRVVLTGSTWLHAQLASAGVIRELREGVNAACADWLCESIVDETRLPLDLQAVSREGLFASAFLDASATAAGNRPDEIAQLQDDLLQYGIEPDSLSLSDLDAWENDAREVVLDSLHGSWGRYGA